MELNEPSAKYLVESGYKFTEAGVLPNDWTVSTVGAEFHIQLGKMLDAERNFGTPKPYLGNRSVQWGRIDTERLDEVKLTSNDMQRYRLRIGDLLVCEGGEVGRAAIWLSPLEECYFQKALHRLRPTGSYSARLMQKLLERYSCTGLLKNYVTQTSIAHLPKDKFECIPIPVPTPAEQAVIDSALDDADALIESLEQLLAKKRQIKQGAMQELLTGQRRLPGFSDGWTPAKLEDLAEIRSGGTPSTQKNEFWDGDIFWCTPTDITALNGSKYLTDTHRKITAMGMKACSADLIPANSIVMTSRATIGECAINVAPLCTNQGFKNFVPFPHVDVQFLYYMLTTQKAGFISLCGGSTFLEIGKTQLRPYEVSMPPTKDEQTAIATVLSDMDTEITALEARLTKARQIKQGMAQALLTGRIRLV